jgi:hypothetical protein
LHQNKTKEKQDTAVGQTPVAVAATMMTSSQHLIPWVVARVVGLLHTLQDHVHHLQDVTSRTRILGDSWDRRHTQIIQNLGHLPHQGGQPTSLGDAVHLDILKKPPKLDELHQLIMIVSGVDPLGLCLCQRHRAQLQVPLPLIKPGPLLPQHLVEVENLPIASSVLCYPVKVLLPGSLDLGPLLIKRSANLGKGLLRDPRLLLPCDRGLFPPGELPLQGEEFLDYRG